MTMKRISRLQVDYEDGTRELFIGSGTSYVAHTASPPLPGEKPPLATPLSYVTATLVIPTPPEVVRQMAGVKLDPRHD